MFEVVPSSVLLVKLCFSTVLLIGFRMGPFAVLHFRGRVLLVYILFPDFERADSWAKRMRFYFWYSRSKNVMAHLQDNQ